MQVVIYFTAIFEIWQLVVAEAADLDYSRQDEWGGWCNNGSRQSPININQSSVLDDPSTQPLFFNNLGLKRSLFVTNTGYQVRYALVSGSSRPKVEGGRLNGTYVLENFHFHWPSEHTIDGQYFDLEGHFVFYSTRYSNIQDAFEDPNGLAVIGVFYQIGDISGSKALSILADATSEVSEPQGSNTTIDRILLRDLIPYDDPFFTYKGSLTTPDCNEIVNWYLFESQVPIDQEQFEKLSTIYDSSGNLVEFNNREIQPLNGRSIYYKPVC